MDVDPTPEELRRLGAIVSALEEARWDAMMTVRKPKTGPAFFEPAVTMPDGQVRRIRTLEDARMLGVNDTEQ
jgi:hypothetical protein